MSQGDVPLTPLSDLSLSAEGAAPDIIKTLSAAPVADLAQSAEGTAPDTRIARRLDPVADQSLASELGLEFVTEGEVPLTPLVDLSQAAEGAVTFSKSMSLAPTADLAQASEGTAPDIRLAQGMDPTADTSLAAEAPTELIKAGVVVLTALTDLSSSAEGTAPDFARAMGVAPVADLGQSSEVVFADTLTKSARVVPVANTSLASSLSFQFVVQGEIPLTPLADLAQASEDAVGLIRTHSVEPVADLAQASEGAFTSRKAALLAVTANTSQAAETPVELVVAGRVIQVPNPDLAQSAEGAAPDLLKTVPMDAVSDLSASDQSAPDTIMAITLEVVTDLAQSGEFVLQLIKQGQVPFIPIADLSSSAEGSPPTFAKTMSQDPVADLAQSLEGAAFDMAMAKILDAVVDLSGSANPAFDIGVAPPTDLLPLADLAQSSEATVGLRINRRMDPVVDLAQSSDGGAEVDGFSAKLLALTPNHFWKLDEVFSATTVVDYGTDGDGTGTYENSPTLAQPGLLSSLETSVLFDTTPFTRAESNNTTSWQTAAENDSFIYGARFNINDFSAATNQWVIRKEAFFDMQILDDGTLRVRRTTAAAALITLDSPANTIIAGQTHKVILVFEREVGGGMRLWVDGAIVNQDSSIAGQNSLVVNRTFYAAVESDVSGELFNGRLQHIWMFKDTALTPADILDLFDPGLAGGVTGLSVDRGLDPPADSSSSSDGAAGSTRIGRRMDPPPDDSDTDEDGVDISLTGPLDGFAGTILEVETLTAPLCRLEDYLSKLDIFNVALTKLGIETLTATSDDVSQATAMNDNWTLFKGNFLRDHIWNGAKTTQALVTLKDSDTTTVRAPVDRWQYAYVLPTSPAWVRSVRLNGKENRPGPKSRSGVGLWEEEVVFDDLGDGTLCLVCDEAEANLEYIFLLADNQIDSFLPEDMQWALALSFAVHMAADLGSSNVDINQLEQQAEIARRNARRTDGQSGAKFTYVDTSIADAFF